MSDGPAARPPSGEQYMISHGAQVAVVVEVGGGVRAYRSGSREVLQGYPVDAICDGAHGTPLAPWPNRLGDGRFTFDGASYQVPLTEPDQQNAIHGFLRWRSWACVEQSTSAVTMCTVLHPMPFWPFALEVTVDYALDDDGLSVTTVARNLGDRDAPWAYGQHPYLSCGDDDVIDNGQLTFHAGNRIATDHRQLPTGQVPVRGTPFDFSAGRPLGSMTFDDAFADLARDGQGRAWLTLAGADGRTVALWVDGSYPYLEIFTGDTLAPGRARRGLGVEPMTAPPNALQSHTDVRRLAPGGSVSHRWGVRLDP